MSEFDRKIHNDILELTVDGIQSSFEWIQNHPEDTEKALEYMLISAKNMVKSIKAIQEMSGSKGAKK